MNVALISEIIGVVIPILAGLYYVTRKTITTETRLEQLEKEVKKLESKKYEFAETCRQGRILIHEEVKSLAREVSKLQGRLDK